MKTFVARTLTETTTTEDRHRFEMTFVDAGGQSFTISIPSSIAADLVPILESVAADQKRGSALEFTRLPKACAVGCSIGERMVLLRFDEEPPYAIGLEVAEALGRELQDQSEQLSVLERPALN
jgi:hypothetical protein